MFGNHCWIIQFDLLVTREEQQRSCYNQNQTRFQGIGTKIQSVVFSLHCKSFQVLFKSHCTQQFCFYHSELKQALVFYNMTQKIVHHPSIITMFTDRTRSHALNLPSDAYRLSFNGFWYILGSHIMNNALSTSTRDIFSSQVKELKVWLRSFLSFKDNQWHISNGGNE